MDYTAIINLVYEARRAVLDSRLSGQVSLKGAADFVTKADLAVSEFVCDGLKKLAPDVAFVTEEESVHSTADKRFILDPVDGTANLVYGYDMCSISLAYYESGRVEFAVVYCPFFKHLYFAIRGRGAHFFDASDGIDELLKTGAENYSQGRLSVSQRPSKEALVEFGASSTNKSNTHRIFELVRQVFEDCMDVRRISSAAMTLCFIAAGKLDGYFTGRIKPWDYAAGALILEEAGGIISQWNGERMNFSDTSTLIAGNPDTHAYLHELLKDK